GSHRTFVVAKAAIANTVAGEFARSGVALCKTQGAISRGEYVRKSATSKAIEGTGLGTTDNVVLPEAALGIALAATSGGLTLVELWGFTNGTGALQRLGADLTLANSVAETQLLVVTVPAGLLGAAGRVEARGSLIISGTGSAPTITFRWKYGAT